MKKPILSLHWWENLEDKSLTIELHGRGFRLGITIEDNVQESGAYYIDVNDNSICVVLPDELLKILANKLN